jgi:hypothetical protein
MRKFAIFLVTALVLSLAAVAYAAQTNEYSISGSTSPKTSGSKSKPRPIGIKFGFDVKEATGQRPAVVQKYTITFGGTRVNKSVADTCSKSALEDQGTAGCKAKSIVGTGFIENQTGSTADANDKSIECNAALSVVNHSGSSASIYVKGDPNSTNPKSKGSQLTFTVPQSLRHPGAPTISNAVVSVESTIKRITKGGKGFYEARGGCTRGKRTVSVKFTTEAGQSSTESKKVACS